LEGTFVIDLGVDLDNSATVLLDEIVDPNELEVLERQTDDSQAQEIIDEYEISDDDEDLDNADYEEEDGSSDDDEDLDNVDYEEEDY
jgi:hypothetical protein